MKKLILLTTCLFLFLTGCNQPAAEKKITEEYAQLKSGEVFYYGKKEDLKDYISHGTGILFLGFPECPWCQVYLPMAEEVLEDQEMECMYYNIFTEKKNDRAYYDDIASLIISQNDTGNDIVQYDSDGKQVIYMPLMLFIQEGRIIAFDNETCTEDSSVISPEDYWTDEKTEALKERLAGYTAIIKEVKKELDAKGCDTGCKVETNG